jgi:cell division protein FtsA
VAQSLVYGIDVGTTKVVAIAGRVDPRRGWVEVLSMGEAPSYGLKRGVVVDRRAAADSVAEAMKGCGVRGGQVTVGIAGSHISSFNTEVTLLNRSRDLTVTDRFVSRLEQEARQLDLDEDERVLHVVPRGYVLDGSEGVKNPLGLAARKVTASRASC